VVTSRIGDPTIERNNIAEPDASDYAFPQVNSDRDKVVGNSWHPSASSRL